MSNNSRYVPLGEDGRVVTMPICPRPDDHEEFFVLFREGMALVEKTANYLDGPGRRESKCLQPYIALAYATESMRLTTRLTQLATWLLTRRAIINGERVVSSNNASLNPLELQPISRVHGSRGYDELPGRLKELIEEAYKFHQKISNFGRKRRRSNDRRTANPVAQQIAQLESAFA